MASKPLTADPRRLRTSARFLLRSLSLRHSPFLLALLAVTVAATLAAALLGLKADLHRKLTEEMRGFGPNLILAPAAGAGALLEEGSLRQVDPLLRRAGIAPGGGPCGILLAAGRVRSARVDQGTDMTIVGADLSALARLNPSWKVEGRWPEPGSDGCVAGSALAERLQVKNAGALSLEIGSAALDCRVTGIVSTGESEEEEILISLARLQEKLSLPGRVSLAALSVEGDARVAARAARLIQHALPGSQARVVWQVASAQGRLLGKLDRLALSLSLTVFLLCGLCVMTTLLTLVLEREPEIGLMRSLGAGDGEILTMFLGEVTLLGILGAALGLGLGMGAARIVGHRVFETQVAVRLEVIPWVLAASLLLCWLSVLLPLKRALAVRPAEALRGN